MCKDKCIGTYCPGSTICYCHCADVSNLVWRSDGIHPTFKYHPKRKPEEEVANHNNIERKTMTLPTETLINNILSQLGEYSECLCEISFKVHMKGVWQLFSENDSDTQNSMILWLSPEMLEDSEEQSQARIASIKKEIISRSSTYLY